MGKLINGTFIPQWQLNGERRPLPPLYEAVKKYGDKNVYFDKPQYVGNGYCLYCGKEITNKRRKSYCSDECMNNFQKMTIWKRGRDAYGTRILYRDNFTCQDCGEFHAYQNEFEIYLPVSDGQLEIHHIIPVSEGGGDEPSNLITLCKECHKKRHKILKSKDICSNCDNCFGDAICEDKDGNFYSPCDKCDMKRR